VLFVHTASSLHSHRHQADKASFCEDNVLGAPFASHYRLTAEWISCKAASDASMSLRAVR
jgi:hypothetical protein